jgi:hypothetical protein
MVQGQIRQLDPVKRVALIALEDGREVSVTFPADAHIEVREPTTMGTMGGTLEDLKVGYWVEASLHEHGDSSCSCTSLLCTS